MVINRTRLHDTVSAAKEPTSANGYVLAAELGTLDKQLSSSVVRLIFNGSAAGGFSACEYELRIDGVKDNGSSSTSYEAEAGSNALVPGGGTSYPVTIVGEFKNLTVGEHAVSMWVRAWSGTTKCTLNPYAIGQDVFVEETM